MASTTAASLQPDAAGSETGRATRSSAARAAEQLTEAAARVDLSSDSAHAAAQLSDATEPPEPPPSELPPAAATPAPELRPADAQARAELALRETTSKLAPAGESRPEAPAHSPLAATLAAPPTADAGSPTPRTVQVRIGRVLVRAPAAPSASRDARPRANTRLSLDDYLARRNGSRR